MYRLLNKLGADLLGSVVHKINRTLDVVRESFNYEEQLVIIFKYMTDQTQTPNSKVNTDSKTGFKVEKNLNFIYSRRPGFRYYLYTLFFIGCNYTINSVHCWYTLKTVNCACCIYIVCLKNCKLYSTVYTYIVCIL